MSIKDRISEVWRNYVAFMITLSTIPFLTTSYLVVSISKHYWLKILSSRYPHLDFIKRDSVRTLIDTHRNQGVYSVLICVEGQAKPAEIRQRLIDHVLERKDHDGYPMFPRMCSALVSRWGSYAWDSNVPFKIENHFTVATGGYRGRPITDNNIQGYVSEIVSKYFPARQPPWQYVVIPSPVNDKYYILIRVHHLLLTCESPVTMGDLLLIDKKDSTDTNAYFCDTPESHLDGMQYKLSALPELYGKLGESCSNSWNEFIAEYDPLESTRAFKDSPGIFHCIGLAVVVLVNAFKDIRKALPADTVMMIRLFFSALRQECQRRGFTLGKIILSPFITFHPKKAPLFMFKFMILSLKVGTLWPLMIHDEFTAWKHFLKTGKLDHPHTLAWKWGGMATLTLDAGKELWKLVGKAYITPRRVYEDVMKSNRDSLHSLQKVSLGGRKVCAWSPPIQRAAVTKICKTIAVSPNDVYVYAVVEAVFKFLEKNKQEIPKHLPIIANSTKTDLLLTKSDADGCLDESKTGFVCATLPVHSKPTSIRKCLANFTSRQKILTIADPVEVCHALPSPCARVFLNLLSRKYSLLYEYSRHCDATKAKIIGQEVSFIVYWKPPQANASMSLTVVEYADSVRLGVMCDARLAPGQVIPAQYWTEVIDSLTTERISRRTISENRPQKSNLAPTPKRRLSVQTEVKTPAENERLVKKTIGNQVQTSRSGSSDKSRRTTFA